MPDADRHRPTLRSRLLWFVALWTGGVLTLTAVGAVVRAFLAP